MRDEASAEEAGSIEAAATRRGGGGHQLQHRFCSQSHQGFMLQTGDPMGKSKFGCCCVGAPAGWPSRVGLVGREGRGASSSRQGSGTEAVGVQG
jgi:hypothetical protein